MDEGVEKGCYVEWHGVETDSIGCPGGKTFEYGACTRWGINDPTDFLGLYLSQRLIKKPNDLACHMLPPRLLVVHDPRRRGQDDVPELTRGQQLDDPFLKVADADVVAGRDDAGFVKAVRRIRNCSV